MTTHTSFAGAVGAGRAFNTGQDNGTDLTSAPEITPFDARAGAGSCRACASRETCLGAALATAGGERAVTGIRHKHTLDGRDHLFHEGDPLDALYVVKSGSVKLYLTSEDGSEQVVAFYMPGEILGLDALADGTHRSSAMPLERSTFCVLPRAGLEGLTGTHQLLYRLLSRELARDHHTIELITRRDAETKMASFLLDLSDRFRARGYSARNFNLSMKRNEIGSHLGLAVETVSRILTRFQDEGLLSVNRRHLQIQDFNGLRRHAGQFGEAPSDSRRAAV